MHDRKFVHNHDGGRDQKQVGSQGMSAEVEAVYGLFESKDEIIESDGQVDGDEDSQVEKLGGVNSYLMVTMVSEHKPSLVIAVQVECEDGEDAYLDVVRNQDILEIDQHQFDEADDAPEDVAPD